MTRRNTSAAWKRIEQELEEVGGKLGAADAPQEAVVIHDLHGAALHDAGSTLAVNSDGGLRTALSSVDSDDSVRDPYDFRPLRAALSSASDSVRVGTELSHNRLLSVNNLFPTDLCDNSIDSDDFVRDPFSFREIKAALPSAKSCLKGRGHAGLPADLCDNSIDSDRDNRVALPTPTPASAPRVLATPA